MPERSAGGRLNRSGRSHDSGVGQGVGPSSRLSSAITVRNCCWPPAGSQSGREWGPRGPRAGNSRGPLTLSEEPMAPQSERKVHPTTTQFSNSLSEPFP